MKTFNIIKTGYLILCLITIYTLFSLSNEQDEYFFEVDNTEHNIPDSPTSIMLYELIEVYSDHYNIPRYIAYNIAFKETGYLGPFHWRYNPRRESCAGAVGAMQVMPSTCNYINKRHYSKKMLRDDLKLNLITSMKLLNRLHKKYSSWTIVCGCYNTGKPIINDYARYCSSHKNYKDKWLKFD